MAGNEFPNIVEKEGAVYQYDKPTGVYNLLPELVQKGNTTYEFDRGSGNYYPQVLRPDPESVSLSGQIEAGTHAYLRGITAGQTPNIAGVSGAIGGAVGTLQEGGSLGDAYENAKSSFKDARTDQINKQNELATNFPKTSMAMGLAGSYPLASLMPVTSLASAAKVGAISGGLEGLGSAQSLPEAATDIGVGTIGGIAGYGLTKGVQKTAQLAKDVGSYIQEKLTPGFVKLASTTSGISPQDIRNYIQNTDKINAIVKQHGSDIPAAVDEARKNILQGVIDKKNKLGTQIQTALENSVHGSLSDNKSMIDAETKLSSTEPILNALEKVKDSFHETTQANERLAVDEMISMVHETAPMGETTLPDIFALQKKMQDTAANAYIPAGKFFAKDTDIARAAKAGYTAARQIVNEESPQIAQANQQYSLLHILESKMNKNLLNEGKTPTSYLAGGSGENQVIQKQLQKLGEFTGSPVLAPAQDISAANSFAAPSPIPSKEKTGYSWTRAALGGTIGGAIALARGGDTEDILKGGAIGAAALGPLALKTFINANNVSAKAIQGSINLLSDPKVLSILTQNLGPNYNYGELKNILIRTISDKENEDQFKNQKIPDQTNNAVQRQLMNKRK